MNFKSDIDRRFIEAVDHIKSTLNISERKILAKIGVSNASYFGLIRKGERLAQHKHIDALCDQFTISKAYIYNGIGDVDNSGFSLDDALAIIDSLKQEVQDLKLLVATLKKDLYEKNKKSGD